MTKDWRAEVSGIVDRVLGEESYFKTCPRDERGYCEPGGGGGGSGEGGREPLTTRNREWGFFGTAVRGQGEGTSEKEAERVAVRAWNEVSAWLVKEFGASRAAVRAFLDSKWGRHMADAGVESDFTGSNTNKFSVDAIRKAYSRPKWRRELRGQLRVYEDPDLH